MLTSLAQASALVGAAYCIGASQLDQRLAVLLVLAIIFVTTRAAQHERASTLRAATLAATGQDGTVKAVLTRELVDTLPAWVTFPDTERAEWLNTFVNKYWPYLSVATEETMLWSLNPIFEGLVKGTPLRRLAFVKFSLGGTPLKVTGVRCQKMGLHSEILLDLDVRLVGRPDVELHVGVSSMAAVPVTLSELMICGTLRIQFTPLCTEWPCFAGMAVGFVRQPIVDCRLAVATNAFNIMALPGVSDSLREIICYSLSAYFTWPNFVPIRILDRYPMDTDFLGMAGILEVELLEATGLKRPPAGTTFARVGEGLSRGMTTAVVAMSSVLSIKPYATVQITGGQAVRTKTSKDVHPRWAESWDFIVDHLGTDVLTARVWDDQIADATLGQITLAVDSVAKAPQGHVDKAFALEGGASGMYVHLRAQWRPFPLVGAHVAARTEDQGQESPDPLLARNSIRTGRPASQPGPAVGVLVVQLHSGSSLKPMDLGGTSDPYAVVRVGGVDERSRCISRTTEPRWEERFRFLVRDVDTERLTVAVWDRDLIGDDDLIGEVSISVADLTQQTTKRAAVHKLEGPDPTDGDDRGQVSISTQWRRLVHASEMRDSHVSETNGDDGIGSQATPQ